MASARQVSEAARRVSQVLDVSKDVIVFNPDDSTNGLLITVDNGGAAIDNKRVGDLRLALQKATGSSVRVNEDRGMVKSLQFFGGADMDSAIESLAQMDTGRVISEAFPGRRR